MNTVSSQDHESGHLVVQKKRNWKILLLSLCILLAILIFIILYAALGGYRKSKTSLISGQPGKALSSSLVSPASTSILSIPQRVSVSDDGKIRMIINNMRVIPLDEKFANSFKPQNTKIYFNKDGTLLYLVHEDPHNSTLPPIVIEAVSTIKSQGIKPTLEELKEKEYKPQTVLSLPLNNYTSSKGKEYMKISMDNEDSSFHFGFPMVADLDLNRHSLQTFSVDVPKSFIAKYKLNIKLSNRGSNQNNSFILGSRELLTISKGQWVTYFGQGIQGQHDTYIIYQHNVAVTGYEYFACARTKNLGLVLFGYEKGKNGQNPKIIVDQITIEPTEKQLLTKIS